MAKESVSGVSTTFIAATAAIFSTTLYCANSELLQALQVYEGPNDRAPSPMLNLLLCHLGGLFLAPWYAKWSDAYGPSKEMQGLTGGVGKGVSGALASRPRMTALLFALILMGYNYVWLLSSTTLPAQVSNAIFQVSIAFVYVVSVPLFGEDVSAWKIVGVLTAVLGAFMAGGVISSGSGSISSGVVFALVAAQGVALYQLLFRQIFGHLQDQVDFLGFFFSWVSIWHVLVVAPLVVVASITGFEHLQLPSGTWAIVGTVLSAIMASTVNFLYLFVLMLGSPMLFPCASILTIPLSVVLDAYFHGLHPTMPQFIGHLLILASVVLILQPWKFLLKDGEEGESPLTSALTSLRKRVSGKNQQYYDDPFLVKGYNEA